MPRVDAVFVCLSGGGFDLKEESFMPMITVKDLTFGYDGSDELLFRNVNLTLDTTWKLALSGRNGRGKTTFFRILKGELRYEGTITGMPEVVEFPMD